SEFALDAVCDPVNFLESLQTTFLHETGHKVCELDPSLLRFENCREDVRVAFVALLGREILGRRQLELSTISRPSRATKATRTSRMAAKTLGESNRGAQYQSIEPSSPTRAAVCMSPMTP